MSAIWFCIVTFMLTMYAILGGFDLGAGVIHLFLAREGNDRRSVLAAAGRFWDGNVVWLLLAGGALYGAFPAIYLRNGFYPLAAAVASLLVLRGISAEFRRHTKSALWGRVLDISFGVSGLLLVVGFGAAVGCVVRGVPPTSGPRLLNWFPILCGLAALACLTMQSAAWMALKSSGALQARCRSLASHVWWAVLFCYAGVTVAAFAMQPNLLDNLQTYSWISVFAVVALAGLIGTRLCLSIGFDLGAFASASCLIAGLLASAAAGQFPYLPDEAARSLAMYNAGSSHVQMGSIAIWWAPAFLLAVGSNVNGRRTAAQAKAHSQPRVASGIRVNVRISKRSPEAYSAGTRARASRTSSLALRTISTNSVQSAWPSVSKWNGSGPTTAA